MHDKQKGRDDTNISKLKGLFKDPNATDFRLILHAKNTGSWLTVRGNTVTGTVLSAMKFCELLRASYDVTPLNFQKNWRLLFVLLCMSRTQMYQWRPHHHTSQ